jgi:excinuclease ABC subunit C
MTHVKTIDYIITGTEKESLVLENRLIKNYQPKFNVMWRDDKSYPYLKISPVPGGYPQINLVRLPKHKVPPIRNFSVNRPVKTDMYYGPFPQIYHLKKLMTWLRKLFFIGMTGSTDEESTRFMTELSMFFNGRYDALKTGWEHKMKSLSDSMQYEAAALVRDNIYALDNLYNRVRLNKINRDEITEKITASRSLSDLKEKLGLPIVPVMIEAFDISNTAGTDPVGSMVRFTNGTPDKTNYRRYKIKTVTGIDDFSMLAETVSRRYSRLMKESTHMPGLVIIDGGKGQLSSALSVFNKLKIRTVPVISLAKKQEEIYLPEKWGAAKIRPEPVTLPPDSPALRLVQHIRDEAHRFAIRYHRLRRKKSFISP